MSAALSFLLLLSSWSLEPRKSLWEACRWTRLSRTSSSTLTSLGRWVAGPRGLEWNQPVLTDLHKFAGAETNQQLRKAVVPHPTSSAGSDSQHILGEKLHFESSDLTGSEGVTGEEGEEKKARRGQKKITRLGGSGSSRRSLGGLEDGARGGGGGSGGGGCVRKGEKSFVVSVWWWRGRRRDYQNLN